MFLDLANLGSHWMMTIIYLGAKWSSWVRLFFVMETRKLMKINQYFKASAKSSLNKVNIICFEGKSPCWYLKHIILNVFLFILFSTLLDKVYAEEGETGGDWGRLGEDWGKNAIKWWEDTDHSDHPEQIVSMAARPGSSVVLRRMMRCEKRQGGNIQLWHC